MTRVNDKRRLTELWEDRHTHDTDPDVQQQITVINNTIGQLQDQGSASNTGAFVHLIRAATQEISVDGEVIEWDQFNGVITSVAEFMVELPATQVVIPKSGYYNVAVQLGWDVWAGGGSVQIIRNPSDENEVVWPPIEDPGIWSTTDGQFFEGVAPAIPLNKDEVIEVFVDHGDSSAQDLASATLAVYLVDRYTRVPYVTYEEVVLADGPIAYWRFDEPSGTTAADTAGHVSGPFDMSYENTPDLDEAGVMNDGTGSPSVGLDGSKHVQGDDWTELDFPGSDPFTLEAWVETETTMDFAIIVAKQVAGAGNGWDLYRESSNLRFHRAGEDDGSTLVHASGYFDLGTTGVIYHVVAVYDGSNMTVYRNGAAYDGSGTSATITASGVDLSVGRDTAPGQMSPGQWVGRIDEVAIYDYALTPAQIELHYAIGTRG